MATFGNVLSQYRRLDTIEVECGNDFVIELCSYQSKFKALGKEQARLRSAGLLKDDTTHAKKKKFTSTASRLNADLSDSTDRDFVLGSQERDMKFFAENIIVGWNGLSDDDGNAVEHSPEMALALLQSPGGEELYNELLLMSMDVANFANSINPIEEDEKN